MRATRWHIPAKHDRKPARDVLAATVMHRDPKREAQMVEEAGLNAVPVEAVNVANPDAIAEKGIEAATEKAKLEGDPRPAPRPQPRPSRQDGLDRERAAGEGMPPPPSQP